MSFVSRPSKYSGLGVECEIQVECQSNFTKSFSKDATMKTGGEQGVAEMDEKMSHIQNVSSALLCALHDSEEEERDIRNESKECTRTETMEEEDRDKECSDSERDERTRFPTIDTTESTESDSESTNPHNQETSHEARDRGIDILNSDFIQAKIASCFKEEVSSKDDKIEIRLLEEERNGIDILNSDFIQAQKASCFEEEVFCIDGKIEIRLLEEKINRINVVNSDFIRGEKTSCFKEEVSSKDDKIEIRLLEDERNENKDGPTLAVGGCFLDSIKQPNSALIASVDAYHEMEKIEEEKEECCAAQRNDSIVEYSSKNDICEMIPEPTSRKPREAVENVAKSASDKQEAPIRQIVEKETSNKFSTSPGLNEEEDDGGGNEKEENYSGSISTPKHNISSIDTEESMQSPDNVQAFPDEEQSNEKEVKSNQMLENDVFFESLALMEGGEGNEDGSITILEDNPPPIDPISQDFVEDEEETISTFGSRMNWLDTFRWQMKRRATEYDSKVFYENDDVPSVCESLSSSDSYSLDYSAILRGIRARRRERRAEYMTLRSERGGASLGIDMHILSCLKNVGIDLLGDAIDEDEYAYFLKYYFFESQRIDHDRSHNDNNSKLSSADSIRSKDDRHVPRSISITLGVPNKDEECDNQFYCLRPK